MLSAKSVIPECYIDSNLFDVLLNFERESVNHTKGNATVIVKMDEKFADLACVGIIDKDKRDLPQIEQNYDRINIEGVEDYFIVYKHRQRHHFLIKMVPAIEEWICKVANELGVDLTAEELGINASTPHELAKITKNVDKKADARFKKLFKKLVRQSKEQNFYPLLKLQRVINLIRERAFDTEINDLINV